MRVSIRLAAPCRCVPVNSDVRLHKPAECPCNALLSRYFCSRYFFASRHSQVLGDSFLARAPLVRSSLSPTKPEVGCPPSSSLQPMAILSSHSRGLAPSSLKPPLGRPRRSPVRPQGSLHLPAPLTDFNAQAGSAMPCISIASKGAPMDLLLPALSISHGNAEGAA